MQIVMQVAIDLVAMTCGECGIAFAMPAEKYERCKSKGEGWYCPNGHGRVFTDTELAKAKKALEEEKAQRKRDNDEWTDVYRNQQEQITDAKRTLKTTRAALTRTKNKIKRGSCPCCNTNFTDLAAHMAEQHPDYGDTTVEVVRQ